MRGQLPLLLEQAQLPLAQQRLPPLARLLPAQLPVLRVWELLQLPLVRVGELLLPLPPSRGQLPPLLREQEQQLPLLPLVLEHLPLARVQLLPPLALVWVRVQVRLLPAQAQLLEPLALVWEPFPVAQGQALWLPARVWHPLAQVQV